MWTYMIWTLDIVIIYYLNRSFMSACPPQILLADTVLTQYTLRNTSCKTHLVLVIKQSQQAHCSMLSMQRFHINEGILRNLKQNPEGFFKKILIKIIFFFSRFLHFSNNLWKLYLQIIFINTFIFPYKNLKCEIILLM